MQALEAIITMKRGGTQVAVPPLSPVPFVPENEKGSSQDTPTKSSSDMSVGDSVDSAQEQHRRGPLLQDAPAFLKVSDISLGSCTDSYSDI